MGIRTQDSDKSTPNGTNFESLISFLNQKEEEYPYSVKCRWIKSPGAPDTPLRKEIKRRRSSVSVNTNTHTHTAHSQGCESGHAHTHTHTHTTFLPLYLRGVRESWRNPTLCVLIKTHRTLTHSFASTEPRANRLTGRALSLGPLRKKQFQLMS